MHADTYNHTTTEAGRGLPILFLLYLSTILLEDPPGPERVHAHSEAKEKQERGARAPL